MIIWESYTKPWMHLKRDELPLFNLKFLRMFCDSLVATYAIVQSVVFLTTTFIWHHITDLWCNSNIYIFYHINFGPHISPHSVIWFDGGKNNFLWLFFFFEPIKLDLLLLLFIFLCCVMNVDIKWREIIGRDHNGCSHQKLWRAIEKNSYFPLYIYIYIFPFSKKPHDVFVLRIYAYILIFWDLLIIY